MKRWKLCIKTIVCLNINNDICSADRLECHFKEITRSLKLYSSGQDCINIFESKLSYRIPGFPLGISAGNTRGKNLSVRVCSFPVPFPGGIHEC